MELLWKLFKICFYPIAEKQGFSAVLSLGPWHGSNLRIMMVAWLSPATSNADWPGHSTYDLLQQRRENFSLRHILSPCNEVCKKGAAEKRDKLSIWSDLTIVVWIYEERCYCIAALLCVCTYTSSEKCLAVMRGVKMHCVCVCVLVWGVVIIGFVIWRAVMC